MTQAFADAMLILVGAAIALYCYHFGRNNTTPSLKLPSLKRNPDTANKHRETTQPLNRGM